MKLNVRVLVGLICLLTVVSARNANAAVITLSFEGLLDNEEIQEFYNGGTGSLGSSGPNYGISFGGGALALIDQDAGGSGNFANEPTPDTIAFWLTGDSLVMNVAAGFDTGFSFFYTSSVAGAVTVWDAPGGATGGGNLLATVNYGPQPLGGCGGGDPTGAFSCWDPVGVSFSGIAMSADFTGGADVTGFDNITLGTEEAGGAVPEPATMWLLTTGLGGAAWRRYRLGRPNVS
jgi:hypothetical protein